MAKRPEPKARWGAIPKRAFRDPTLHGADLKVLGVVSMYDGFSKNGMGCYATLTDISANTGLAEPTISTRRKRLVERGYLGKKWNPKLRRVQYHVIFDDEDNMESTATEAEIDQSCITISSPVLEESAKDSIRNLQPQVKNSQGLPTESSATGETNIVSTAAPCRDGSTPFRSSLGYGQSFSGESSLGLGASKNIPQSGVNTLRAQTFGLQELRQKAHDGTLTPDDIPTDTGTLRAYTARIERTEDYSMVDFELLQLFAETAMAITDDTQVTGHIERVCDDYDYALNGEDIA